MFHAYLTVVSDYFDLASCKVQSDSSVDDQGTSSQQSLLRAIPNRTHMEGLLLHGLAWYNRVMFGDNSLTYTRFHSGGQ